MNKQVIVYFGKEVTERAKNFLINTSKDDMSYLTKKFKEAIIDREMRNYRFLYKGQLIICYMYETKNLIKVFIDDVYHI